MIPAVSNGDKVLMDIPDSVFISDMPIDDPQAPNPQELKGAFDAFNQLSNKLSEAYHQLEQRVVDLSSELDLVTEQRFQELTEKEQLANRLETLLNCLPGGVIVIDRQGIVLESNPVAEEFLEAELRGKTWRDLVARCFSPRKDDGHEVSTKKGRRISIVTRSLNENGQIILLTDQTETRQLQDELSRSERLTALGKVVSTLAHQVRTPLASALLYANHLRDKALEPPKQKAFANKLINRLHFMERQVKDMLLYVKGEIPLNDRLSLTEFVDTLSEAIEMPLESHEAKCTWEVASVLPQCQLKCNLDALVGAILNLVNNSLQVEAKPDIKIIIAADEQKLNLQILDNGPGMTEDTLVQAKELFFTTKAQGTGIGLSVVSHVAQAHGGQFILENRAQGGLCASLELAIIYHP